MKNSCRLKNLFEPNEKKSENKVENPKWHTLNRLKESNFFKKSERIIPIIGCMPLQFDQIVIRLYVVRCPFRCQIHFFIDINRYLSGSIRLFALLVPCQQVPFGRVSSANLSIRNLANLLEPRMIVLSEKKVLIIFFCVFNRISQT